MIYSLNYERYEHKGHTLVFYKVCYITVPHCILSVSPCLIVYLVCHLASLYTLCHLHLNIKLAIICHYLVEYFSPMYYWREATRLMKIVHATEFML
jgi:hypothetical protein